MQANKDGEALPKQFAHLASPDIEQEIAFLQDRERLFEEDDRFMSLVLPGELSASLPAVHKKSELHRYWCTHESCVLHNSTLL
jgi:hypothetical protein